MITDIMFGAKFWQAILADTLLYAQCFGTLALLAVLTTAIGRWWPRHT